MTTIIIDRAVLERAVEALQSCHDWPGAYDKCDHAVKALRKAFNAPSNDASVSNDVGQAQTLDAEPKLVAWMYEFQGRAHITFTDQQFVQHAHPKLGKATPLYTAPPEPVKREWVGLTNAEIDSIFYCDLNQSFTDFASAIEQALKERNHE